MEYQRAHPEHYGQTSHPNTAKHLSGVWIAVRSIEQAGKSYERISLLRKRLVDFPRLQAKGLELEAATGRSSCSHPPGIRRKS
jgi:hypothetical protein